MSRILEEEMRLVAKLDPKRITKDGYYRGEDNQYKRLTRSQIQAARLYFHDSTLAANVVIHSSSEGKDYPRKRVSDNRYQLERTNRYAKRQKPFKLPAFIRKPLLMVLGTIVVISEKLSKRRRSSKKKYRLQKSHRYDGRHQRVRIPKKVAIPVLTAVGVVWIAGASLMPNITSLAQDGNVEIPPSVVETVLPEEQENIDNMPFDSVSPGMESSQGLEDSSPSASMEIVSRKEVERKEYIRSLCNIYQVNFDVVYNRLVELTDNFEGIDYCQNGHIANVTCKGVDVYTTDEEALLLYFVRCAKQLPDQLGFSSNVFQGVSPYDSGTDYASMIDKFCNILGSDRCLVYAIAQTETSWDSTLFREANNPAGLQLNGSWWRFDSKEEGFIELILEIKKYNAKGAYTIEEIGAIHAPTSDGNELWVPNVTSIYQYVKENESAIFGNVKTDDLPNVY